MSVANCGPGRTSADGVPGTNLDLRSRDREDRDNMLAKIIGFALLAWAIAAPVSAAETLYGADGSQGNLSNLLIPDARNGALICTIGPIGFSVTGLAVHPT